MLRFLLALSDVSAAAASTSRRATENRCSQHQQCTRSRCHPVWLAMKLDLSLSCVLYYRPIPLPSSAWHCVCAHSRCMQCHTYSQSPPLHSSTHACVQSVKMRLHGITKKFCIGITNQYGNTISANGAHQKKPGEDMHVHAVTGVTAVYVAGKLPCNIRCTFIIILFVVFRGQLSSLGTCCLYTCIRLWMAVTVAYHLCQVQLSLI